MRSLAHISKFVVNINLIIMFNSNIYLFSRAFFSESAGGILHIYSGFSVNDLAGVEILVHVYDYYGLRLGKAKTDNQGFRVEKVYMLHFLLGQ